MAKVVDIGKEAYEEFLTSNGDFSVFAKIAKKYALYPDTVNQYVVMYRHRVISPKPTKEEEKLYIILRSKKKSAIPNYTILDIIDDVLSVNNEEEKLSLLQKYEFAYIERSIKEFTKDKKDGEYSKDQIKALDVLNELSKMVSAKKQEELENSNNHRSEKNDIITNIINDYLLSDEIYPNKFINYYSTTIIVNPNTIAKFYSNLESFRKQSKSNEKLIAKFFDVRSKRIEYLINAINLILIEAKKRPLKPLDIELLTGLDYKSILMSINKSEIDNAFSNATIKYLNILLNKFPKTNDPIPKEEAYKINYSIKNQELNPNNGDHTNIDRIYTFFETYGISPTMINITTAFMKMVNNELTVPESLKSVYIGKEAFEEYISSQGNPNVFGAIAKKYNILIKDVKLHMKNYRQRVISPKPTDEQIKAFSTYYWDKKYEPLDDILSAILNANTNADLERIYNNYEWSAIRSTVNSYIYSTPESDYDDLQRKVWESYQYMEKIKEKKNQKTNNNSRQQNIDSIINEYIESNTILPNNIILKYYKNTAIFRESLTFYAKENETNAKNVLLFNKIKEDRINSIINIIKTIINGIVNHTITTLDIQLLTNMPLKEFRTLVLSTDISEKIGGKRVSFIIMDFIDQFSDLRILTEEEVLNLHFNINGREMTTQDIKQIIDYLNSYNLPLTKSNIYYSFAKLIKGEIKIEKIMNNN